ncbi:hypothetical protein JW848_11150 [Candidatus Bipolaricaulota bacterium]|nr:hypothetical protein [Candidatus Bipolaricaulota bacterium]
MAAWVLLGPRHKGYDAQVRPDLRGGAFEREVLQYADERTVELMRRHGIEGDRLLGDAPMRHGASEAAHRVGMDAQGRPTVRPQSSVTR